MTMFSNNENTLIRNLIRNVPIFKKLSDDQAGTIAEDFSIINVKKNKTILLQSDSGTDLYIILSGEVKVTFLNEEGYEFIVTTFREGDFFGEISLIDGKERSASVITEKDTTLGLLTRKNFLNAVNRNPVIAISMLTELSDRLRKADDIIESLAFLDVRERLIRFLVANGKKEKKDLYRTKKCTHNKLAARIGASREAVSKVMKELISRKAVIDIDGDYLFSPSEYLKGEKVMQSI